MIPPAVLDHIDCSYERSIADLFDFLRIPSVSPVESHTGDVRRAAEWLLGYIKRLGLSGSMYETPGHPIVYAEHCSHPGAPTVMFYAHYDVTPSGLPEEWETPPFEPVLRNDAIYARGAVDDKGQLFTVLQAIASMLAVEGGLPLNVKLLFEGEEEWGSPSLKAFVEGHRVMLNADMVVVVDILKYRADLPAIYYGAKGLLTYELEVSGPATDVHSGIYGGEIANPAQALCHIIDHLKDNEGKILVPGFYDRVRDIRPKEKARLAFLPFDEPALKATLGIDMLTPEKGYTPIECAMARPTLDVNGLRSGSLPEEPVMMIPARAEALISMRLVPDQDIDDIGRLFETYVRTLTPPGVKVKLRRGATAGSFLTSPDSEAVKAAKRALEYAFGVPPVLVRSGGSSGVVPILEKALGIRDIVITGWGGPGAGEHSPDEHISLDNYRRGIIATAAIIYQLASAKKSTLSDTITT